MSTKISQAALSTAASDATSRKMSNGQSRKGGDQDQETWTALRARASRLLLTDPDAVVYLHYLSSNSISAQMSTYHGLLCECIVIAESMSSRPSVGEEESKDLALKKGTLANTVASVRADSEPNQRSISKLRTQAAAYANSVAKNSSRKNKIERKESSLRDLFSLAEEASKIGRALLSQVLRFNNAGRVDPPLQKPAKATILPRLSSVLRQEDLDPAEEALAVVSAVAAYDMLSRAVHAQYVAHSERRVPFEFSVDISGPTITLRQPSGVVLDPALVGVSTGHWVYIGESATQVSSVGSESFTLSEELGQSSGIIIRTPAQKELYEQLLQSRKVDLSGISRVSTYSDRLRVRNMTRPDAYKIVNALAPIAARFAPLNSEAARSAAILGVEVPESSNIIQLFSDFNPSVSRASSSAVSSLFESLRGEGLDRAVKYLLTLSLGVLAVEPVEEVRSATAVSFMVGQLMDAVTSPVTTKV